jgi:2-amino-4-hydroxy-6-hydroxymethyldihydropteridine diphosphokinase
MTLSGSKIDTAAVDSQTAWLGLGTNLGDRAENLARAIAALERQLDVLEISSVYESDPVGHTDQPQFWNMVLKAHTLLEPTALLTLLKVLEPRLGRTATFRMGPRIIDIDILLYGQTCLRTDSLTVPHPGLLDRAFVLLPLLELDPALRDPRTGEALSLTAGMAAAAAAGAAGVRRLGAAEELLPLDHWRNS